VANNLLTINYQLLGCLLFMKLNTIVTGVVSTICVTIAIGGIANLALIAQTSPPKSPPLVLVPQLTSQNIDKFINTYGKLMAVKFTPTQKQQIKERLQKEWTINLGLRRDVLETLALEPELTRATPAERDRLQAKMAGELRQQVLEGDRDALWLLSYYDTVPSHWLAKGQPPLTRIMADMSANALVFMVNEIMGKSVASNNAELKNAIAKKMTAEYATLPPNVKRELSRLPLAWLQFQQSDWATRGEDFREEMRVHWGQNLEAFIPEIRAVSKLRRDRLNKLKTDRTKPWYGMDSIGRQAALNKTDAAFDKAVAALPNVAKLSLSSYVNNMQVGKSIGNSPTRYAQKLNVR
jgi:hypothetical protein